MKIWRKLVRQCGSPLSEYYHKYNHTGTILFNVQFLNVLISNKWVWGNGLSIEYQVRRPLTNAHTLRQIEVLVDVLRHFCFCNVVGSMWVTLVFRHDVFAGQCRFRAVVGSGSSEVGFCFVCGCMHNQHVELRQACGFSKIRI